jgi:hypothetical protein
VIALIRYPRSWAEVLAGGIKLVGARRESRRRESRGVRRRRRGDRTGAESQHNVINSLRGLGHAEHAGLSLRHGCDAVEGDRVRLELLDWRGRPT